MVDSQAAQIAMRNAVRDQLGELMLQGMEIRVQLQTQLDAANLRVAAAEAKLTELKNSTKPAP